VSCRVVSCRVVSCRVVSCRVVSCRVVSCRVVSCRVVSCCVLFENAPVVLCVHACQRADARECLPQARQCAAACVQVCAECWVFWRAHGQQLRRESGAWNQSKQAVWAERLCVLWAVPVTLPEAGGPAGAQCSVRAASACDARRSGDCGVTAMACPRHMATDPGARTVAGPLRSARERARAATPAHERPQSGAAPLTSWRASLRCGRTPLPPQSQGRPVTATHAAAAEG
jgi:hypothetical protein